MHPRPGRPEFAGDLRRKKRPSALATDPVGGAGSERAFADQLSSVPCQFGSHRFQTRRIYISTIWNGCCLRLDNRIARSSIASRRLLISSESNGPSLAGFGEESAIESWPAMRIKRAMLPREFANRHPNRAKDFAVTGYPSHDWKKFSRFPATAKFAPGFICCSLLDGRRNFNGPTIERRNCM